MPKVLGATSSLISQPSGSNNFYGKKILRIEDLPLVGASRLRCNLGANSQFVLRTDYPIHLWIADTQFPVLVTSEIRFTGEVKHVYLSKIADTPGRVVIYAGANFLANEFNPEDPSWMSERVLKVTGAAWATTLTEVSALSIAVPDLVTAFTSEAIYVKQIFARRDQDGTIDSIEYRESETGLSFVLFDHKIITPSYSVLVPRDFTLRRISSSGAFFLLGSNETPATTFDFELSYVGI